MLRLVPTARHPGAAHNGIAARARDLRSRHKHVVRADRRQPRLPLYPHVYVLPDGRIFVATTTEEPIASRVLDITTQDLECCRSAVREGGSSVMYLPGKILKTGKAWNPDYPVENASAESWVIDMTQIAPTWRQVAPMAFPRTQHQLTVLPDGTVLATGGSRNSSVVDQASAVLAAEFWDPTTRRGTRSRAASPLGCTTRRPRYFQTGGSRSAVAGIRPASAFRSSIGDLLSAIPVQRGRPTITSAPSQANYGQSFFIGTPEAWSPSRRSRSSRSRLRLTHTTRLGLRAADLLADRGRPDGHRPERTEISRHLACTCSLPSTRTACHPSRRGCG